MKTKIPHLILAGLLGTSISSQAATVVWDGSTDTTWTAGSDATSWSGATYNDGDDVEFTGAGAGTVTLSGTIDPNSVLVNSSSDYTFVGTSDSLNVITGGGTLTKSGTGTLHLDGRNYTFTGGITVNDGTLYFNSSPRSNIASSPLTVNGGQVDVRLENFTVTELSGSGGEISIYRRRLTVNQATNTTYAGVIEDFNGVVSNGNGTAFTKTGTGTLTLSGNNTYSKNTTVSDGTLEVSGALYSGGTHTGSSFTVGAAGTLDVTGAGSLGLGAAFNVNIANAGTINYNSTTDQTLSGIISGAGVLTKDNTSTLTLSGVNTYTGDTTVSGGTLQIGGAGQLGSGEYFGNIAVSSGATFQYSSSASGPAAKYQGVISGDGTLIKDSSTSELRLFDNNSIANIEINQGTLRGSADANSLGDAGTTISLGDTSGTAAATLAYGGTVDFTAKAGINVRAGSSGTKTIRNINGTVTDNTAITLNDSLTINDNSALTLGGVISGTGGLTKIGTGTTTLSGANTYQGTTTVSNGTLSLATGYSHTGGGAYTVEGGTLKIADGVTVGSAMTIGLGGVISPGNSPGTASTGAQTWNDGGSYLWEINASDDAGGTIGTDPGWDWLDITGALDLTNLTTGGFTIDIDSLTAANTAGDAVGFGSYIQLDGIADYSFVIASADSFVDDYFDASLFNLDYSGFSNAPGWEWGIIRSGNDLVLEAYAVPEPSSTALLGLGLGSLLLRRRRS